VFVRVCVKEEVVFNFYRDFHSNILRAWVVRRENRIASAKT